MHVAAAVAAAELRRVERARALEHGLVARREVGAAAHHPRHALHDRVEHRAAARARGLALRVGLERGDARVPARGQLAAPHGLELARELGVRRAVARPRLLPLRVRRLAARAHALGEALAHAVRHQELRVRGPAVDGLGALHLVLAERLAVGLRLVLHLGRTPSDVACHHDDGRAVGASARDRELLAQRGQVVGVAHVLHVPAVAVEAGVHVVRAREVGAAVDGDRVAVEDPAEVAELQVPGGAGRLVRDALHQAAVAADGPHVVVKEREAGLVVALGEELARDRHAHGVAEALPQRPGGGLDARRDAELGVAGAARARLAERADVVHRDGQAPRGRAVGARLLHAGQVQQAVEQHARVAVGEDESVAVGPVRRGGVVDQRVLPERVAHGRQAHRRARVAAVCRLHRVHRERAQRVDGQAVDDRRALGGSGVRVLHRGGGGRRGAGRGGHSAKATAAEARRARPRAGRACRSAA